MNSELEGVWSEVGMAQFKLLFCSWPVETPSVQVRLFPSSSFAQDKSSSVLWQSGAHLLDCNVYIPEDHNLDWFITKPFSSAYCIFFLRNVHSIWIVLQPNFSISLYLPEPVTHFPPTFFLSFKWHLSQPVVLILMLTCVIILCLKSSLCICLCYIWRCACCILFFTVTKFFLFRLGNIKQ